MPFSKTNESNSWSVGPNKASYWYSVRLGHRVYVFGFSTFCTIDYLYRIICRLFVPRTVHITDYSYHTPFIPDFFVPLTIHTLYSILANCALAHSLSICMNLCCQDELKIWWINLHHHRCGTVYCRWFGTCHCQNGKWFLKNSPITMAPVIWNTYLLNRYY